MISCHPLQRNTMLNHEKNIPAKTDQSKTARTTVTRSSKRANYEKDQVIHFIQAAKVGHLAFEHSASISANG